MTRTEQCFVDTMRPASGPQVEGWACYLALHRDHWRAARVMFRKVHLRIDPTEALLEFVAVTGLDDQAMRFRLEVALRDLAEEARGAH